MAAIATAALGTFGLAAPASAAEAQTAPIKELVAAMKKGEVQSDYVQYRRYYRGGPRYVGRGYYAPQGYYADRRYYRRDRGNALAAGALGLATGAIVGSAIAQSQAAPTYVAPGGSAAGYCAQRFKSYDPASGTYLGYDGLRHPCP